MGTRLASSVTIADTSILRNTAGRAGGLLVSQVGFLSMSEVDVDHNVALVAAGGAALRSLFGGSLDDVDITNNVAGQAAGGLYTYVSIPVPEVDGLRVRDNNVTLGGDGGVFCDSGVAVGTGFGYESSGNRAAVYPDLYCGSQCAFVNGSLDGTTDTCDMGPFTAVLTTSSAGVLGAPHPFAVSFEGSDGNAAVPGSLGGFDVSINDTTGGFGFVWEPAAGAHVSVISSNGTVTGLTSTNGQATLHLIGPDPPLPDLIFGTAAAAANVSFGAGPPVRILVSATPTNVLSGDSVVLTFTLVDAAGNPPFGIVPSDFAGAYLVANNATLVPGLVWPSAANASMSFNVTLVADGLNTVRMVNVSSLTLPTASDALVVGVIGSNVTAYAIDISPSNWAVIGAPLTVNVSALAVGGLVAISHSGGSLFAF